MYVVFINMIVAGGIKQNGVAITSGGNLAAKHVLHLDVQGLTDKGEWKKGITRCLQQAERNELSSISFPALGTGKNLILTSLDNVDANFKCAL